MKGEESFVPVPGEYIQVIFVPMPADGKPYNKHYVADVDQFTGTFVPDGAMRTGMPPGRYRAAVHVLDDNKKDIFRGKFDENRSTFVFDVDADTEEIVIDLDHPPATIPSPRPVPK